MEDRFSEIKSALEHLFSLVEKELLSQREEIELLKKTVEQMQKNGVHPEPVRNEPVAEKEQEAVKVQDEPLREQKPQQEPHPSSSQPSSERADFSFDDGMSFEIREVNEDLGRKPILGELFSSEDSVADYAIKNSLPWMTDVPGPEVEKIADALPLNDRMFFIRTLFGGDEDQFDLTLDRIDEAVSFKDVVNDMRNAFPEWDESSDGVYRFYMVVRRKLRN